MLLTNEVNIDTISGSQLVRELIFFPSESRKSTLTVLHALKELTSSAVGVETGVGGVGEISAGEGDGGVQLGKLVSTPWSEQSSTCDELDDWAGSG